MGKKLFAESGKIVAREMNPNRCECDAFNHAVNEETILWDPPTEDESGGWVFGEDTTINFCPFCGLLAPLTAHSGGVKHD